MSQKHLENSAGVGGVGGGCVHFYPTQQPQGEQKLCWGRMKPLFEAIVFLFEISVGWYPSTPIAVYSHFQLRREISKFLRHYGLLPAWGTTASQDCFWDFFSPHVSAVVRLWFHANQFDCVCSLLVFFFFFCFSHNPLQSPCTFCRSVCADMHWRVNVYFPLFFSPLWKEKIGLLSL